MVEWQACDNSQLVLLTIANKLDFSDEKKLFSRIVRISFYKFFLPGMKMYKIYILMYRCYYFFSHLQKFERLAFVAYSFQELEVIIQDRLKEFHGFKPEAIQFIARCV